MTDAARPAPAFVPFAAPRACRGCGGMVPAGRALCMTCMSVVTACRAALAALLSHRFIEPLDGGGWWITPGAQWLADMIYWTAPERFGYPARPSAYGTEGETI